MKIYAPSYKRSKGVKTHKILPEVIYCVHQFEAEQYKDFNIEILPDDIKGNIARVRNYIKDNLIKDEGLIIDDDIESIKRWDIKDDKPYTKDIELREFIEQGFNMCKESGAKLWGVNIVGDKGSYREYTPISFTNWISGSFMGFVNNQCKFDERLPLKEDLDFCLQNFNQYRKVLRFNYVFLQKRDHGNKGGCADYRTIEKEKEQLKLLQKKWGTKIVKMDTTQKGKKIKTFDINPVLSVPIKGV